MKKSNYLELSINNLLDNWVRVKKLNQNDKNCY